MLGMLRGMLRKGTQSASLALNVAMPGAYLRPRHDIRAVFYHGVGSGPGSIAPEIFSRQVDYLESVYRVMPLSEAVDEVDRGCREKPPCCITFDDGHLSVYTEAFPILRDRGLPFAIFVNTAAVGNHTLLWSHALAYLVQKHGLSSVLPRLQTLMAQSGAPQSPAATSIRGLFLWCHLHFQFLYSHGIFDELWKSYKEDMEEVAGQLQLCLTWQQLHDMQANGAAIYSHTHNHFPLNSVTDSAVVDYEIRHAMAVLADAGFEDNRFMSFPFGMENEYGQRAVRIALNAGHQYLVEVGDGGNDIGRLHGERILSRVGLETEDASAHNLHAAIELRPLVKSKLRHWLHRGTSLQHYGIEMGMNDVTRRELELRRTP